jgi:uncharacterized membrane protein
MDIYMIILRLVHFFSAIFWVGSTFFMVGFLEPTVRASGPEGGRFMQRLMSGTRFTAAISAAGGLAMLSGLLMYWQVTSGLTPAVIFGSRLPLTVGALAGITAGIVGGAVAGRSSARLAALGQQISAQAGPPNSTQLAEMQSLQETLRKGTVTAAILMSIAVIGMALP